MRTLQRALFIGVLTVMACDKKEVDTASLNTNPFDRDYTGTPLVQYISAGPADAYDDFGNFIHTAYRIEFKVRADLFPHATAYSVQVHNLTQGGTTTTQSLHSDGDDTFHGDFYPYQAGQEYCMEVALVVNYSPTRTWTICQTYQ